MKIIDAQHTPVTTNQKKRQFHELARGDIFIQGGRVLMRLDINVYRVEYQSKGDQHGYVLQEYNAVRLGVLNPSTDNPQDVIGKLSKISLETVVTVVDDIAALYLWG